MDIFGLHLYMYFCKKKDCNLSTSICRFTRSYLDCNASTFFLPNQHIVTIGPGYVHFGMARLYLGLAFFNPRQLFFYFSTPPPPLHTGAPCTLIKGTLTKLTKLKKHCFRKQSSSKLARICVAFYSSQGHRPLHPLQSITRTLTALSND